MEAAAKHRRQHLGDFIYEAVIKPQRLLPSTPVHRGFSSTPKPLPWDVIRGNINGVLTVKVPRVHLSPIAREEITARGFLWGTDVYTDDSDVVAACIHGGWIRGEWHDDVDVSMLDLGDDLSSDKSTENKSPIDKATAKQAQAQLAAALRSEQLISAPPPQGPMGIPADRDLHVEVVILPRLARYASTTRFGIASREFGSAAGRAPHEGLSYAILGIRWVENGAQPQARLRGKARRERMRKAMQEVHVVAKMPDAAAAVGHWRRKEEEHAGKGKGKEVDGPTAATETRAPSEGDKENRTDVEMGGK